VVSEPEDEKKLRKAKESAKKEERLSLMDGVLGIRNLMPLIISWW